MYAWAEVIGTWKAIHRLGLGVLMATNRLKGIQEDKSCDQTDQPPQQIAGNKGVQSLWCFLEIFANSRKRWQKKFPTNQLRQFFDSGARTDSKARHQLSSVAMPFEH